jgi:hypothetical protein
MFYCVYLFIVANKNSGYFLEIVARRCMKLKWRFNCSLTGHDVDLVFMKAVSKLLLCVCTLKYASHALLVSAT